MTTSNASPAGTPAQLWQVEIRTRALDPAIAFYKHVFDWTIHRLGDEYAIVDTGLMPVGAIAVYANPGFPLGVGNYILSDDCEAAGQRAVSLGGRICVKKTEVEGSGWFVGTLDPWGNELFFWQPLKVQVPPQHTPHDHHFCWLEIPCAGKIEAGVNYYRSLLGWRFQTVPGTADYAYTEDGGLSRGVSLVGGERGTKLRGVTNYVMVADLKAATARLAEAGGKVLMGPVEIEGEGSFLVFRTPEDLRMAMFAPAPGK